jgi:hypothetical protein
MNFLKRGIKVLAGGLLCVAACYSAAPSDDADQATERVSTVAEASRPSPCTDPKPDTLFCDDFDSVTNVADGWTILPGPTGSGTLDTTRFFSPPASYKAAGRYVQEVITPPGRHSTFEVSFDLRIDTLAAGLLASLSGFSQFFGLSLSASGQLIVDDINTFQTPARYTLPLRFHSRSGCA